MKNKLIILLIITIFTIWVFQINNETYNINIDDININNLNIDDISKNLNKSGIHSETLSKVEVNTNRNIYLYWVGKEYKLILILRYLIYLHSLNGEGYVVNLINNDNISDYINKIPDYFDKLLPAHQADFVRVSVICDRGGIWIDSDTLVIDKLDSLFDIIENKDGFFIKQGNNTLWNGIFGSKKNTPLILEWKKRMIETLENKKENINWAEIGNNMLTEIYDYDSSLYNNYKIFNGLDNLYPVNWDECVTEFINKPYDNYRNIIKDYQPLIALVNTVYKELENKSQEEILNDNIPLNYFINKSISNFYLVKNK